MSRRIVVYDDSPVYGGHEVMAAYGIDALVATGADVRGLFHHKNQRLLNRLNDSLPIETVSQGTKKFQSLRNRFTRHAIKSTAKRMATHQPDVALIIQGDIEISSIGLLAARSISVPTISYIPVPHSMATMGAKLGSARDSFNRYLFQVPDRFITISESMAELLRKRGTTAPIDVVYNGIEVERFTTSKPRPKRDPVLGLIGRIEFNQKQQDFLVRAIADEPRLSLRIVGDGPDRGKLDRLIASLKLQDRITVETWRDDPAAFYQEIDCLVIPSRYEGVPLVMLEALSSGIPVVGSDRDGMRDLLPGTWRYPFGEAAALRRTLDDTLARDNQADLQSLQNRIHESMTLPAFKQHFTQAVLEPAHAV
jgi:glycosyltransferase involved in cell wall biosynthesis